MKKGERHMSEGQGITGQALTMTELIAYQEGSVVSRTLIDKKVGTVTVFAFGEGQGLSEHTVPYDAFIEILDGEAEVTIADTVHHLVAGQMIIMPADRPHLLKAVKRFKMLLVMIREKY
jgi:quercetin dioxygenase-like cupin family protein